MNEGRSEGLEEQDRREMWRQQTASTDTPYNVHEPTKHCSKWKKPNSKGHILHHSISIKCPEKANPQKQKVHQWRQGWERRGMLVGGAPVRRRRGSGTGGQQQLHNLVNTPKTTDLYTLKE